MRPEAVPDGTGRDAAPAPAPAPVPAARAPAAPVAVRGDAFARLMAGQRAVTDREKRIPAANDEPVPAATPRGRAPLDRVGDKMSWDATDGAVVEDDRRRRYEGVWVSASARHVNSAPLSALAPMGRPPVGGKCGPIKEAQ